MILGNGTRANSLGAATGEPATSPSDAGDVVAASFSAQANEFGFRPKLIVRPHRSLSAFRRWSVTAEMAAVGSRQPNASQSRQALTLRSKKDRTQPGTWRSPTYSRPSGISGYALIDTGASITGVDEDILRGLSVVPIDAIPSSTPSGEGRSFIYPAKISFPGLGLSELRMDRVIGCKPHWQTSDGGKDVVMLLGRDLLQHFLNDLQRARLKRDPFILISSPR